ncbi:hypothetical protein Scep_013021 [Stephania cephalantha]|uniref:F-box/LRR-repeat protein 15/At3g58940/PEG3-like LRR domain-containing protein n=1 Tax=Stephania cephalantha TaxID=152367 RepID=A0AAP0P783_9MAGN
MSIEEDRISELPDSILVNEILSRLSTKCALRTTILSKRWRWLWTNVPALKFSHTSYTVSGLDKAKATLFMNYVDVVLLRHQTSNLRSFKLVCDGTIAKSLVYSWISTVAHPNKLHELYVDFCELEHYVIPSSVYRCRSLKVLSLSFWWSVFKPPITSVSLPSLASLELHCANFVDENLTKQFISSLPALELLVLRECYFYNHHELLISGPSLKVLTLSKACFKPNELGNWRIKICAPKLDQLYCQTNKLPREYILDVPVLQDVWIHPEKWDNSILTKEGVRGTACDLLKQIAHVKKLGIHADLLMPCISLFRQVGFGR